MAISGLAMAGCSSKDLQYQYPDDEQRGYLPQETGIFGGEGFTLLGIGANRADANAGGGGIGVNGFLWRAAIETISFMPLASADPFGGIILTDWYSVQETPDERFKLNVVISDRQLRSDAIRVTVFRQRKDASGNWADAKVEPKTATDIENSVLTRARQLRIDTAQHR